MEIQQERRGSFRAKEAQFLHCLPQVVTSTLYITEDTKMYLHLQRDEQRLLVDLVETRIHKLRPEMRLREGAGATSLKRDLEILERILRQLHEAECDVLA